MGVWDTGLNPSAITEDNTLLSQDRNHSCFFTPSRESMLFNAAIELQKREEENRQLKDSNTRTTIGLWIAALGLILNAILEFIKLLR